MKKIEKALSKIDWRFVGEITKWLLVIAAFVMAISFLTSCSNSKKVSNQVDGINALQNKLDSIDDAKLAKGVADFVKKNPCVCPPVKLDSLCDIYYPCIFDTAAFLEQFNNNYNNVFLNTPDDPKPHSSVKPKAAARPQIILQPFNDSRLAQLQEDTITALRKRLDQCQGNIAGRSATVKEVLQAQKPGPWKFNYWSWIVIAFTLLYILKIYITKKFW